jgi:hypothetical protein
MVPQAGTSPASPTDLVGALIPKLPGGINGGPEGSCTPRNLRAREAHY